MFDMTPQEPAPGDYVTQHGANICHIMRPGYVGSLVVYDCSTCGHTWYRAGRLERYFEHEGHFRSVIYVGERQRILLDHVNGRDIFELAR
jgi:hypothetical protein